MHQIHVLRSEENSIVLVHAHDELSHEFVAMLLRADWQGGMMESSVWEGQAVFPLHKTDLIIEMAKFEGIDVVEGPTCL